MFLDIINFLVASLRNQDNKVEFIRVDEDGSLSISSEFVKIFQNMNIIFQTIDEYSSSLNGKY